jgi:tRNA A-37 threonylcarbamoyl transferase component Bud32
LINLKNLQADIKIIERLFSRRNEVYKVELSVKGEKKPAIMKVYNGVKGADRSLIEYKSLMELSAWGIDVPSVMARIDNVLLLEFIPGIPVVNLAERLDMGPWIEKTAWWLAGLHGIKTSRGSFLKGDANLRNFIFFDNKVYGLDFEERHYGDPREDIAEVCFFLLTDSPSLTSEKDIMVRRFLKAYKEYSGSNIDDITGYILKSKDKARDRRRKLSKKIESPVFKS